MRPSAFSALLQNLGPLATHNAVPGTPPTTPPIQPPILGRVRTRRVKDEPRCLCCESLAELSTEAQSFDPLLPARLAFPVGQKQRTLCWAVSRGLTKTLDATDKRHEEKSVEKPRRCDSPAGEPNIFPLKGRCHEGSRGYGRLLVETDRQVLYGNADRTGRFSSTICDCTTTVDVSGLNRTLFSSQKQSDYTPKVSV